jgi:hypothetical protein
MGKAWLPTKAPKWAIPHTHSAASSENRIRQFCVEALAASDDTVLDEVLPRLQAALAEHIHNVHIKGCRRDSANLQATKKRHLNQAAFEVPDVPLDFVGFLFSCSLCSSASSMRFASSSNLCESCS